MNRRHVGHREFGRATAGRGPVAVGKVREASPVLADGVSEFIFADVFSRPGLSAREREFITVAVLCTLGGAEPQLGLHIPAALECGVDPDELVAMCEQITPYAGFPRALNALRAVRAALEERGLPLPLPAERLSLGDHETLVTDVGEGDGEGATLVLVHPLGLDRLVWRDVVRSLPAGGRALAYDLRGHGGAAGAPRADTAGMVGDLLGVLEARSVAGPLHLVGAGTGADSALRAAAALGERAQRVTLLAPGSPSPADGSTAILASWLSPTTLAADGPLARYLRDRVVRAEPEAWAHLDTSPAPAVSVPTAVVVGTDDPQAGDSERRAAALGVAVRRVPGAGHMLPVEAPAQVAALLSEP